MYQGKGPEHRISFLSQIQPPVSTAILFSYDVRYTTSLDMRGLGHAAVKKYPSELVHGKTDSETHLVTTLKEDSSLFFFLKLLQVKMKWIRPAIASAQ